MATRVSHSKQSTKHGESPLVAEEWQLRILWELHKKQPRPTVEQRKQLAVQTGLDAKWIARWFKRVTSASKNKSKHQNRVGCPLSPTAAATATNSIDGSNPVESAESIATGSGTFPSLFSPALEHPPLFSHSGVVPASGRSATTGPYHGSPQSQSWELEHTAMAPALQASLKHHSVFHPHSQGANPAAAPHPEHSQQAPLGVVSNPVCLASPFNDGTSSSPGTQAGMGVTAQSIKSRGGPHKPESPPWPGPLETRPFQLNLVSSEALAPAYTTESRHPSQRGLGPVTGSASAGVLGPTSAPLPSMYWLLFDAEHEERDYVDGQRADDVSRASSKPLLGMVAPHVTVPVAPTPVSFLAKWEDMLALERRIRSASHGAKSVQSRQAQAVRAVEAHRTKQCSWGEVALTAGSGTADRPPCVQDRDHEQHFSSMSALSDIFKLETHEEDTRVSNSLRSHSRAD